MTREASSWILFCAVSIRGILLSDRRHLFFTPTADWEGSLNFIFRKTLPNIFGASAEYASFLSGFWDPRCR